VGVGDRPDDGHTEPVSPVAADPLGAELPEWLEQVIHRIRRDEPAGDGTLTARVTSLSGAYVPVSGSPVKNFSSSRRGQPGSQLQPGLAPWAKAGIIVEPGTSQGTAYAAVMVTGSHGVRMQYDYTNDSRGLPGSVGPSSPRWLRLTRAGDVITGYDSAGGHTGPRSGPPA
jgi:hypothetical protein